LCVGIIFPIPPVGIFANHETKDTGQSLVRHDYIHSNIKNKMASGRAALFYRGLFVHDTTEQ
jgi:hypothetical protein